MSDFPTLTTDRLVLREITHDDVPAIFAIHGDAALMRWFGADPLPDEEAAAKLVDTFAGWRNLSNPGTRWGLQWRDDPCLIGTCGLFAWHRAWRKCAIGYELAREWHGRGLMREALVAILEWGFAGMDLNRVEAQIHPENAASLRLAQSLGFVEEGVLREVGFWAGRHHDLVQYGLLRRDYLG